MEQKEYSHEENVAFLKAVLKSMFWWFVQVLFAMGAWNHVMVNHNPSLQLTYVECLCVAYVVSVIFPTPRPQ